VPAVADSYEPGYVERFSKARNILYSDNVRGEVSLQLKGKVRMTLDEYENIAKDVVALRNRVIEQDAIITAVRTAVSD
jgi:hypothetical protein